MIKFWLEYSIPKDIENFAILSKNFKNSIKHSIKENTLKIKSTFQTGNSQIVYQYTLPSIFGSIELRREFDHPLDIVGIFTPINVLEIRSEMISYSGKQKFDQTTFLSWETKNSDSNRIILKISNIPQTYFKYFLLQGSSSNNDFIDGWSDMGHLLYLHLRQRESWLISSCRSSD